MEISLENSKIVFPRNSNSIDQIICDFEIAKFAQSLNYIFKIICKGPMLITGELADVKELDPDLIESAFENDNLFLSFGPIQ